MRINECDPVPQIKIIGEDNFAFYKGRKADLVYLDIKNRDHGQTLDEAFLYWDYLFSGIRREEDGASRRQKQFCREPVIHLHLQLQTVLIKRGFPTG